MAAMQYRLLGGLEVTYDGRPVEIGSPKQRAVLALLVLAGGRVVSTDQLIDTVWGAQPPAAATTSLHTYISNLRRALEPERKPRDAPTRLLTRAPGYVLVAERAEVDWFRFEDLLAEGRSLLLAGRAADAAERLSSAWAMSASPPVLDIDDSAAASEIRSRWTTRRQEVRDELLGARLANGEHRAVLRDLEDAVAEQPYDEGLRAKLVTALYRSGRQRDALQALQDARRVLADEVGVEPGPELRRLEAAVLDQASDLDWVAPVTAAPAPLAPAAPAPAPVATAPLEPAPCDDGPPFVGRRSELESLMNLARSVRGGHGRAAVITGEPGIGKTRLIDELAAQAEAEGMVVARARAPEDGTAPAFWTVGQHGEQLLASGAVPAEQLMELGRLMMRTRRGDPSAERFAIHAASVTALSAASRPLLIVLDDAQWADTATLRLTSFVAGELRSIPLLLVLTVRSNEPEPSAALLDCLSEMARAPGSLRIALHGLPLPAVQQWLARSALAFPTPSTASLVHDRTAGNPLFVRELVALMTSDSGLAHAPSRARAVPDAVQDVIRRRIGRLPPVTQQLLVTAAVVGRQFALDVLADVAGADLASVLDDLDPAFAAGVLEEDPAGVARVQFTHALFAETLAAELSPARRARLHAAVVTAVEKLRAGYLDAHLTMLAYHAASGAAMGTAEKAYDYAVAAAKQATAQVADEEAGRLWERALSALELIRPADREARFYALLEMGTARNRAGDVSGARDALVAAAELAIAAGEDDALVQALLPLEQPGLWPVTDYGAVDAPLIDALRRAVGDPECELSPERVRLLGMLATNVPAPGEALALGEAAVAAARRQEDPALVATALMRRWTTLIPDRFADRQAVADEVLALDRADGLPPDARATGYFMVGLAAMDAVDLAGAEEALAIARMAAERCGRSAIITEVGWFETLVHLAAGRPEDAEAVALTTYDLYRRTRSLNADTILTGVLLGARADRGRLDTLVQLPLIGATGPLALVARACTAWATAEAGYEAVARTAVPHPADLARAPWDYLERATLVATAYAWWHLGIHADAAETVAARLRPTSDRVAFPGSTAPFLGPVSLALGRLADLVGDGAEARRWAAEAVATSERARFPTWWARALADQAEFLARSDDPADRAAAPAVRQRAREAADAASCVPVQRRLGGD